MAESLLKYELEFSVCFHMISLAPDFSFFPVIIKDAGFKGEGQGLG